MNRSVIVPSRPLKVNRARSPERVLTPWRIDVAHRVVVGARVDGEEVEVLRGSLHGVVRVLQAALPSCLAAPMGATSCPGLASKWILEPASLSQKVTNAPMSFVKARATVTLCSATPFGTLGCCVCTVG